MNSTQLNDTLNTYLTQLFQWQRLLTVLPVDPTELESVLLELHNSLDLINAYQSKDFNQQHYSIMQDIEKTLAKIDGLNEVLASDVTATKVKSSAIKFNLYQQNECR